MFLILIALTASVAADGTPKSLPKDEKTLKAYQAAFTSLKNKLVLVGSEKYVLPELYEEQGFSYYNLKPNPNFTFVASYPNTGNVWVSEVIWLLTNGLDYRTSASRSLYNRAYLLEEPMLMTKKVRTDMAAKIIKSNLVRTYLPFSLIQGIVNSSNKIVYVAQNPKDTAVSIYNYISNTKTIGFRGDIEKYWDFFEKNQTLFSPYWSHLREAIALKSKSNILVLFAEEEPTVLISKLSKFLGETYTDAKLKNLVAMMGEKTQVVKESWRKAFSNKLNARANKWIQQYIGDIKFPNIKNLYG